MTKQSLVKMDSLGKSFHVDSGVIHALIGIDLEIFEGESVAIMGPSGSGKSTLLQLIGCLDRPSVGKYFLEQRDVSMINDQELSLVRATKIGFIFQSYNLIPHFNVYENLAIPFLYQSVPLPAEEIRERVLQAAERVKISHRLFHLPAQISGGEAQRAAIARALAIHPLLILADEPTGNLDSETGRAVLELFDELHQQGSTLIMVTHDKHAASYCSRIIQLEDGCLRSMTC